MSTSTVRSVPASTYRLQVSPDLPLESVAGLVPYLRRLGVDWLYLSPLLEAEPGSDHGYDVVDPTRLDAARGGAEGLDTVARAAHEAGTELEVLRDRQRAEHLAALGHLHEAALHELV